MATVAPISPRTQLADSKRRVLDPLHRLRGRIRLYVVLQALFVLVGAVALLSWIGLFLDFGAFAALMIDWSHLLPRWFRAEILGLGLALVFFLVELRLVLFNKGMRKVQQGRGPQRTQGSSDRSLAWVGLAAATPIWLAGWLAVGLGAPSWFVGTIVFALLGVFGMVVVVRRLMYEFRDVALALVLERKFRKELGDRLITAVELADLETAKKLGYSPEMVEATIHDAAERVKTLPLGGVFRWSRLVTLGVMALFLTLGMYLLTGAVWSGIESAREGKVTGRGFSELNYYAGYWFDRNILLTRDEWPTREKLEVYAPAQTREWQIKVSTGPDVWRRLTWKDLAANGINTSVELPANWVSRDPKADLTINDVEAYLTRHEVYQELKPEQVAEFYALLDRLESSGKIRLVIGEVKMGLGSTPPLVRARALKWVVHDPEVEGAWRSLTWKDLKDNPALLGSVADVPNVDPPVEWLPRDTRLGLTIDELELRMDKSESHQKLSDEQVKAFREVLARLEERAAMPQMRRKLRLLDIPDSVDLHYSGPSVKNRNTMQKLPDNEYTGVLSDLKDKGEYRFWARSRYYSGASRVLQVVPPPSLEKLVRTDYQPAYIAHDGDPTALRGQKQAGTPQEIGVVGVDRAAFDVPLGSEVKLELTTDKPLKQEGRIDIVGREGTPAPVGWETKVTGERTFEASFADVRTVQDFSFKFTDTDGISGLFGLVIRPMEDAPPEVEVKPDVVRGSNQTYMVTPIAVIPYMGTITDEYGLTKLEYTWTVAQEQSPEEVARRFGRAAGLVTLAGSQNWLAQAFYQAQAETLVRPVMKGVDGRAEMPKFKKLYDVREAAARQRRDDILRGLATPLMRPTTKEGREAAERAAEDRRIFAYQLDPYLRAPGGREPDPKFQINVPTNEFTLSGLDLREVVPNLKARGTDIQMRYRMTLALEALDNNIETGRVADAEGKPLANRGLSKQKATILIVSETELLVEIGKEEEKLYDQLYGSVNELRKMQEKLAQVNSYLRVGGVTKEQYALIGGRLEELDTSLEKSLAVTRKVHEDYVRILNEMRTNRIEMYGRITKTKNQIVEPLGEIREVNFPVTKTVAEEFRKVVDDDRAPDAKLADARSRGARTEEELTTLIKKLDMTLAQMAGLISVNQLIKMLREIEQKEQASYERIKEERDRVQDELFKLLINPKP